MFNVKKRRHFMIIYPSLGLGSEFTLWTALTSIIINSPSGDEYDHGFANVSRTK